MPFPLVAVALAAGGAGFLTWGAISETYEAKAVEELASYYKKTYPDYPQNYGLSKFDMARIFGKYRYYVREHQIGYRDYRGVYAKIASDLGITDAQRRRYVLVALMDLDNISDKSLIEYFRGEDKGSEVVAKKVGIVARSAKEVIQAADASLPWYMQPKTLLVVAAVGGIAYLALTTGLARKAAGAALGAANRKINGQSYNANPVKRSRKIKAMEAADRVYEIFHDKKPSAAYLLPPIDFDSCAELGSALEIGYESDKWDGKKKPYLHQFGPGVKLYATADKKALIIHGGNMSVESQGIIN